MKNHRRIWQYWGNITWDQLDHIFPGFLRVEVLTDAERLTQGSVGPIPVSHRALPDPRICCHGKHVGLGGKLAPQYPHSNQLVIWETAIAALSIRKMPSHSRFLDWVALLKIKGTSTLLAGYWTGSGGALLPDFDRKPLSMEDGYIGQPAGWMATWREIMDLENRVCKDFSFLLPYHAPRIRNDGIAWGTDSVEFWSGGLQMWGANVRRTAACIIGPATVFKTLDLSHGKQQTKGDTPSSLSESIHSAGTAAYSQTSRYCRHEAPTRKGFHVGATLFAMIGIGQILAINYW